MRVPVPPNYVPVAVSITECPFCGERVAFDHKLKERLDAGEKGWQKHRHQPQGLEIKDNFSRELALQKKKPIEGRDFQS